MNTKTKFGIGEDPQQFSVYGVALLLKGFDGACDLYPSAEKRIRRERCQMGEWVWAFRWQGLEQMTQCSWR